jgi:hypothetical protein
MLNDGIEIDLVIPKQLTTPGIFEATEDPLAPARGIIFGVAVGLPLWLFMGLSAYVVLH